MTPGSLYNTEQAEALFSLRAYALKTRYSVWIHTCHIVSFQMREKALCWVAQLGVKITHQVRGCGVKVCLGKRDIKDDLQAKLLLGTYPLKQSKWHPE